MASSSKLFTGYRALGFVSNNVPLEVRYHKKHKENYIVTCVGKAFHTYKASNLGITAVSDLNPSDIQCMAVDAFLVFTSCGKTIEAWARGRDLVHTYAGHEHNVKLLLPFAYHLISVDTNSVLKVWDIKSEEVYLEIPFSPASFDVTCLLHPITYKDKIIVGSRQGSLQLWNIKTNKLIYTFPGWQSAVTAMAQAHGEVDTLAIGLEDGRIMLHNIKYDETLFSFKQEWGAVTALSFRSDGPTMLVSGSPLGHIALWDLEEKKLQSQIRDAHRGSVAGMQCLPNEPLMVTSSEDNSLKVWTFDMPDGGGRLLRERSGHSAPPTKAQYFGTDILTAGADSTLRYFSTEHERHNKSLGRASYNKKKTKRSGLKLDKYMMPPILNFAANPHRQSDWDSVLACHSGEALVTTWNTSRSTMGAYKFKHPRFETDKHMYATATCVDVSEDGHFGVIGYSSGHVDAYNMQSGLHRHTYGKDTAHSKSIRSVCLNGFNSMVITAGGDCVVKFWDFKKEHLYGSLKLDAQISDMMLQRDSDLLAVSLDNFSVVIVDASLDGMKVIRVLKGHSNSITGMSWSSNGKWIITSSMDCTTRTWDLLSGRLLDCFETEKAATSLTISPNSLYLCTTHVDDLGVYLWSNMSVYGCVKLRPLPDDYEPEILEMPVTSNKRKDDDSDDEDEDNMDTEEDVDPDFADYKSPEQLFRDMVTFSGEPQSKWNNLLNLKTIKMRNKAIEPPKKPKAAPFFLPTEVGLEHKFDLTASYEEENAEEADAKKRKIMSSELTSLSAFAKQLDRASTKEEYLTTLNSLNDLGTAPLYREIESLSPYADGSEEVMVQFLTALTHAAETWENFDRITALFGIFMQLHGEIVSQSEVLREAAQNQNLVQRNVWKQKDVETLAQRAVAFKVNNLNAY